MAFGLLFGLAACSSSSPTSPSPATGLQVTVVDDNQLPISGVWVQLDNDAAGALQTDVNGEALFSQGGIGAHDVHMFSTGAWVSFLQVSGSQVRFSTTRGVSIPPVNNSFSFLKFSGTLTNVRGGESSQLKLFRTGVSSPAVGTMLQTALGSYLAGMFFLGEVAGAQVSGDLWATKKLTSNTSQGYDSYTTDAVNLGARTFTTVDIYSTLRNVENVVFNAVPSVQPLVTINSVMPPVGFIVDENKLISGDNEVLAFSGHPVYDPYSTPPVLNPYAAIVYPKVLNAFDRYASASYQVEVSGSDSNGGVWFANKWLPPFSNVAISSSMLTAPTVAAGQIGSPIVITPVTGAATFTSLIIIDSYSAWVILAPPSVTSVALPTAFPSGVAPSFITGSTSLTVGTGRVGLYTYDQFFPLNPVSIDPNIDGESVLTTFVPYQF